MNNGPVAINVDVYADHIIVRTYPYPEHGHGVKDAICVQAIGGARDQQIGLLIHLMAHPSTQMALVGKSGPGASFITDLLDELATYAIAPIPFTHTVDPYLSIFTRKENT